MADLRTRNRSLRCGGSGSCATRRSRRVANSGHGALDTPDIFSGVSLILGPDVPQYEPGHRRRWPAGDDAATAFSIFTACFVSPRRVVRAAVVRPGPNLGLARGALYGGFSGRPETPAPVAMYVHGLRQELPHISDDRRFYCSGVDSDRTVDHFGAGPAGRRSTRMRRHADGPSTDLYGHRHNEHRGCPPRSWTAQRRGVPRRSPRPSPARCSGVGLVTATGS